MKTKVLKNLSKDELLGEMYLELLNLYDYEEVNPTDTDIKLLIFLLENLIEQYASFLGGTKCSK